MNKSDLYHWSFPSLLALVGVTIEKRSHWLRKATIDSRLQRGVARAVDLVPLRRRLALMLCGNPLALEHKNLINFLAILGNLEQLYFIISDQIVFSLTHFYFFSFLTIFLVGTLFFIFVDQFSRHFRQFEQL